MSDSERNLLPRSLRLFYVERAVITRYWQSQTGWSDAWYITMETDLAWGDVLVFYRQLAAQFGVHHSARIDDCHAVTWDLGWIHVVVMNGAVRTVLLFNPMYANQCGFHVAPSPPAPGATCRIGPTRAELVTGGLERPVDTAPLEPVRYDD